MWRPACRVTSRATATHAVKWAAQQGLTKGRLKFDRTNSNAFDRTVSMRLIQNEAHTDEILDAVRGAKHSVWIATANLKAVMVPDHRAQPGRRRSGGARYVSMVSEFAALAVAGVEICVLHATPPSRAFWQALWDAGLVPLGKHETPKTDKSGPFQMRLCPRNHTKLVIVDGRWAYFGSANWTGAGLGAKSPNNRNFELGVVTTDDVILDQVQKMFNDIWRGAGCQGCGHLDRCPQPLVTL